MITDSLPNGSGFAGQLAAHWADLLDAVVGPRPSAMVAVMLAADHVGRRDGVVLRLLAPVPQHALPRPHE